MKVWIWPDNKDQVYRVSPLSWVFVDELIDWGDDSSLQFAACSLKGLHMAQLCCPVVYCITLRLSLLYGKEQSIRSNEVRWTAAGAQIVMTSHANVFGFEHPKDSTWGNLKAECIAIVFTDRGDLSVRYRSPFILLLKVDILPHNHSLPQIKTLNRQIQKWRRCGEQCCVRSGSIFLVCMYSTTYCT